MTQQEVAEAAGLSIELIGQLERGVRTSARLSSIAAIANALDCEIAELVDRRDHLGRDRDGGSVIELRDVLLSPALLPGIDSGDSGEPTAPDVLAQQVAEAWSRYWAGNWGDALAGLPLLIGEARHAHAVLGTPAVQPLALAYDLASSMLTQIGRTDLGIIAAERAITTAHGGDDELLWAILHASYSWTLLHQGRHRDAEHLAADMAARVEPGFRSSDHEIGVWGKLLTTAVAPSVAEDRDPAEYLQLAASGAARLSAPVRVYGHSPFHAPLVDMQAAYAYAVLHEPGRALTAARKIPPGALKGITHGAHLMDVAAAHVDAKHHAAAEQALLEARSVSPVWFRHQRIAKQAVSIIRERQTRMSPAIRSLAKSLAV